MHKIVRVILDISHLDSISEEDFALIIQSKVSEVCIKCDGNNESVFKKIADKRKIVLELKLT